MTHRASAGTSLHTRELRVKGAKPGVARTPVADHTNMKGNPPRQSQTIPTRRGVLTARYSPSVWRVSWARVGKEGRMPSRTM